MTRTAGYRGNTRRFTCKLRGRGFPIACTPPRRGPAPRPESRSGNCNVSGRPSCCRPLRAKVIKAFVLPAHCRANSSRQSRLKSPRVAESNRFDRRKNALIPQCPIERTTIESSRFVSFLFRGFSPLPSPFTAFFCLSKICTRSERNYCTTRLNNC